MSGYRRFVAYVYEYRKGKKSSNCGYVKVEVRDARCIMDVHLQCAGLAPEIPCKVYSFLRKDGLMNGILLGSCKTQEDAVSCTLKTDVRSMGDSGIPLERMGGMIFVTEMGSFFGTEWDDQVIRPENFREIKPETPPDKKTEAKEKKPDEREPDPWESDENKSVVRKSDASKPDTQKSDEKKSEGQQESSTETITQEQAAEREEEPQIQFAETSKESLQAQHGEEPKESLEIRQQESTEQSMQAQHAEESKESLEIRQQESTEQFMQAQHAEEPKESLEIRQQESTEQFMQVQCVEKVKAPHGIQLPNIPGELMQTHQSIKTEETLQIQPAKTAKESPQIQPAETAKAAPQIQSAATAEKATAEKAAAVQSPDNAAEQAETAENNKKSMIHLNSDKKDMTVTEVNTGEKETRRQPLPGEDFMPFEDEDFVWCRKIRPEDITCISRRTCALRQNRFVLYGYYNFGHLLLCRRADGKYMFGVPGGYDQQERFMANMFGFPYFKKSRYINLPNDKGGYWYRLIDAPDLN